MARQHVINNYAPDHISRMLAHKALIDKAVYNIQSHPAWVRGLKQKKTEAERTLLIESHPAWVRGLKLRTGSVTYRLVRSHPAWVRGLKLRF